MFNTNKQINVYEVFEHVYLHETIYTSYPTLNPYLYDSDWDAAPEDDVVYEFVYDEVYDNVNERDRMREKVVEMNRHLCYGNDEMISLVEKAVNGGISYFISC